MSDLDGNHIVGFPTRWLILYFQLSDCDLKGRNPGEVESYSDVEHADVFAQELERYEPPHGKTNNLHRRKQRRRSASR